MFVNFLYTKFQMPDCNVSLDIAVKTGDRQNFHTAAILLFDSLHQNDLNKSCVIFYHQLPYIILEPYFK